jgi:N-acetyl-gamma-glutamyl-phosphate reductase
MAKAKVAVFGASGYTGLELLRILARHPGAEVVAVTSREHQGRPVREIFPALARIIDLAFTPPDPEAIARQAEFVFTRCPIRPPWTWLPAFWPEAVGWWT